MSEKPIKFSASVHSIPISFTKKVDEKKLLRRITIEELNGKFNISMISLHIETMKNGKWVPVQQEKIGEEIKVVETENDAKAQRLDWCVSSAGDDWILDAARPGIPA